MPSLIDIRRRIRSVKNTEQITKALKMVSAAKLRRAQDRVIASRPYVALLGKVLANVAAAVQADAANEETEENPLLARRPERRVLLVLVTSDTGKAGAFNTNLIKATQRFVAERPDAAVTLETIGRKGRDFFRKRCAAISGEYTGMAKAPYADVAAIAHKAMEKFRAGETDAVYLLFNGFKSVMAQTLTIAHVLPAEAPKSAEPIDYIYDQPPAVILGELLPKYVETAFYGALLESIAAEHGARMTAMDAATTNAGEMIDKLTLYMNRVRQASITKEIIEVVSGAAGAE
jgi:F-type H+-transporting ATPase subunit gamma